MNNPLAVANILGLVDRLKRTVEDFSARAERLRTELAAKSGTERRRCAAALEQQAARLSIALGDAEQAYQAAKTAGAANYEARKARIGRAYQSSKEQRLKEIEHSTGTLKYTLQKKTLQAERDRDESLAAAARRFEECSKDLAAEQETLAQLERAAQTAFKGYRQFRKRFFSAYESAAADVAGEEPQLLAELRRLLTQARADLDHYSRFIVLRLFRFWFLWAILLLGVIPLAPALRQAGVSWLSNPQAAGVALGGVLVMLILRFLSARRAAPLAQAISASLAGARQKHTACSEKSQARYQRDSDRIKSEFVDTTRSLDQQLKQAVASAGQSRVGIRMNADERTVRVIARHEQLRSAKQARLDREYQEATLLLQQSAAAASRATSEESEVCLRQLNASFATDWQKLQADWTESIQPVYQAVSEATLRAEGLFPPWERALRENWTPPPQFVHAAKFGELNVDVEKLCPSAREDHRLVLPGPPQFPLPLCLAYPSQGSILFETKSSGQPQVIGALNNIILRLLAGAPPGRLNFTIVDPVGLGQNFAGVMHMADYEEQIITSRIWTQSGQIEQKLGDLNEHMEKVIQMYLRNEYATIAEYNEQAGVIAEKYHFLVVADFPTAFTDTAARRLLSIATSGAKCGVFTLIHWDQRQPLPPDFMPDELRKSSVCIVAQGDQFTFSGKAMPGAALALEAPPPPDQATEFIHQVGRGSRDSSRVEVPFEHVAPSAAEVWTLDTTSELRVPIGRTGATKLQYLEIGKGTRQHGLIAGKTGSGKSTLFHVIVTNLSMWASPEQVEFYLVDFKKGVEFKCYGTRRLPHARVVAIESDREFGLSVLQRVDDELRYRGDLFRQLGVQDLPGYKRAGGKPLPRCLLAIDEFQEFFVEDDRIAQTAALLLDRFVRQGRAFGIHVLLGSQTLGGAYTVARTTLGQMVVRIALQCNEADAYLIMDDTNPAPRLLSRPGEGIYNDAAGALGGNSPFQVVWLPENVRDQCLAQVRQRADEAGKTWPGPIIFEGNAPADVRENPLLGALLEAPPAERALAPRIWLGAPNSIKGPTEAVFHRHSGSHLLLVGQREEAMLALLSIGLLTLAAQHPRETVRLILCDTTPPGSPQRDYLDLVAQAAGPSLTRVKQGDLSEVMTTLALELKARTEDPNAETAPARFLIIQGLQRFTKLRYEDDFSFSASASEAQANPAAVLNRVICEGARLGFHVIATCDTYNNVSRFLSRKALTEFEMRVLFQMSANDSASLIDNPKASSLGLHRALFYNAQESHLETFRPYALPDRAWVEQALRALASHHKPSG